VNKYPLTFEKANPVLDLSADFKSELDDFQVFEDLGFQPSGEGEHVLLYVQKKNLTTETLVADLATAFDVALRDIGICGLKDKQGVTEQWLSVLFPMKEPIPHCEGQNWQILKAVRHNRKLRKGIHAGNRFFIRLRNIEGNLSQIEKRLESLSVNGFPNYFGEQRFGRQAGNVEKAARLFSGEFKCKPFQRAIYYSAARSYLFNQYLSLRVRQGLWNQALPGDCFNLQDSNSVFGPEEQISPEIERRILENDIHPAGPLLGKGDVKLSNKPMELCQQVINDSSVLVQGLIRADVKTAWRPLRVIPKSLNWKIIGNCCELQFSLPVGSYATALIRELVTLNEAVW
jgi:tRNA pseudouridine13 synthase